jgi:predicted amidophosphoribosyltransferase
MNYCPECGEEVEKTDRYCSECGSNFQDDSSDELEPEGFFETLGEWILRKL